MKTNNIDKNIKEKLQNRTFQPSTSAWERLSVQLDEQPKQKRKGWFFYIGVAASILLLISVGFLFFNSDKDLKPLEIIVVKPVDTIIVNQKIDQFINEIPLEEALVKVDDIKNKKPKTTEVIALKETNNNTTKNNKIIAKKIERNAIAKVDENKVVIDKDLSENTKERLKKEALQQNPNSRIKVNSNDLLYAVTHSPKEVKAYYAKYNVNREDVLRTIKSELKKSNIKINSETILAEVERTIDDDDFQNNFMKSLKRRVSDIASVIASRNH